MTMCRPVLHDDNQKAELELGPAVSTPSMVESLLIPIDVERLSQTCMMITTQAIYPSEYALHFGETPFLRDTSIHTFKSNYCSYTTTIKFLHHYSAEKRR